jgi:hypothetical protein
VYDLEGIGVSSLLSFDICQTKRLKGKVTGKHKYGCRCYDRLIRLQLEHLQDPHFVCLL